MCLGGRCLVRNSGQNRFRLTSFPLALGGPKGEERDIFFLSTKQHNDEIGSMADAENSPLFQWHNL
jgi:hypothetical protein